MEASNVEGWTGVGKADAVLRLLKGEDAAVVAGEARVPMDELLGWRDLFLQSGIDALARGDSGRPRETTEQGGMPDDGDWQPLDWRLDGERLGRMALALGESISRQQRSRDG